MTYVDPSLIPEGCATPLASKPDPSPASSWLRDDQEALFGSFVAASSGVEAYPIDRVPPELRPVKKRWYVAASSSTLGSRCPPLSKAAPLPSPKSAPPSGLETEIFVQALPSVDVAPPRRGLKSLPRVPQ